MGRADAGVSVQHLIHPAADADSKTHTPFVMHTAAIRSIPTRPSLASPNTLSLSPTIVTLEMTRLDAQPIPAAYRDRPYRG